MIKKFRTELEKLMPGYAWTIHKGACPMRAEASGTKSKGCNRISTMSVVRTEIDGVVEYTVKSAGYGLRAPWLHTHRDGTLARALRGLQNHYEAKAQEYQAHAQAMASGRTGSAS